MPDNPSTDLRNNAVITNGWMYPTFLTSSVKNMDSIVFIPVRDPIYYVKYYLMVPKNQRPGTRAVESFLKEFLQQNDPSCAPL